MNSKPKITTEQYTKRLANLCLRSGLTGMPKDEVDQHILMKSAVLLIGTSGAFTEQEINDKLQLWLEQVCPIKFFDHVNLRRCLVDAGCLIRSSSGAVYQVANPGPRPDLFESEVDQIDPLKAIQTAREEMERRKQAFLTRAQSA